MKMNPYDWTKEIVDPQLFAGRKSELDSIEKEINGLATGQSTPYMAIIGERRVGKSSLLRRVAEISERHKLITVRIELSSITAHDPWEFWREIFHEIGISTSKAGILYSEYSKGSLGFRLETQKDGDTLSRSIKLQFEDAYEAYHAHTGSSVLATYTVSNDLKTLCRSVSSVGYKGIVLMIDEAHYFQRLQQQTLGPLQIKQQLKQALRELEFKITEADRAKTVVAGGGLQVLKPPV